MIPCDHLQRQVILRSNQLAADSASTLATAYAVTTIGNTQMADRAIEFPAKAINDAILNAMERMITLIGEDKNSPYRTFFHDVTASLANGATIPTISTNSKPRIGVIGDVRDATSSDVLQALPKQNVLSIRAMTLKQTPLNYYTDNVRIWHTRTNVVADVVVFSITDEIAKMESEPRGNCPFPDNAIEAIVIGALSYIFKDTFNLQQAEAYRSRWNDCLERIGIKTNVQERIQTD